MFSKYGAKYYDEILWNTFEKGTNNVLVFRTVGALNSIKTRLKQNSHVNPF